MPTPPSLSPGSVDETKPTHTVVLADDSVMTRQALAIAMKFMFPTCAIVGEASDGDEARELCLRSKPSVLITDLRLPKRNGIALITQLKLSLQGMGVMVHTGSECALMLALACEAHPSAVIHSDDGLNGLRKAFEAATTGERYISKAVMERTNKLGGDRIPLTQMEIAILSMVTEGQQTKEIASRLAMSDRTVGAHRESIHKKIGTHDQGELVKWAMRNGLLE